MIRQVRASLVTIGDLDSLNKIQDSEAISPKVKQLAKKVMAVVEKVAPARQKVHDLKSDFVFLKGELAAVGVDLAIDFKAVLNYVPPPPEGDDDAEENVPDVADDAASQEEPD